MIKMHYHTQITILDLDDIESIIVQEITVAEAEKIIGGNVAPIQLKPAIKCKFSSVGDCLCQGENKKCWLIDFSLEDLHGTENQAINQAINQSNLYKSSITSLNVIGTKSVI